MPKRRRKLSKAYEQLISKSKMENELILAKINDIYDDDIRGEYAMAFAQSKILLDKISNIYKEIGYTEDSDALLQAYLNSINVFKTEYEI